jgi:hypothetical protein
MFGRACHRIPFWATSVQSSPPCNTAWTLCHFHIKYLCVSLSALKLLTAVLFSAIAFPCAIQLIVITRTVCFSTQLFQFVEFLYQTVLWLRQHQLHVLAHVSHHKVVTKHYISSVICLMLLNYCYNKTTSVFHEFFTMGLIIKKNIPAM